MLGTVLMLVGTVALLVALLEGGILWNWASPVSIGLLAGSLLVLVAFVLVERRAAEPVLPLWVFRHRVVGAAMATSLVVGVLLLGLTSYVPLFAQGVLGTGAIVAGFALAAMTIGWPIAAATSGRLYLRFGFRTTMLIGSVIAVAGAALLLTVDASSSVLHLAAPNFVMGLGFGYVAPPGDRRGPVVGRLASGAASPPARRCSPARSARPWASPPSVRSPTGRAVRLGSEPTNLESLPGGVLDPAIHAVFLASFVVAADPRRRRSVHAQQVVEVTG